MIVRLMCLCTTGKITLPGQESGHQGTSLQSLNHLTAAIGALVEENTAAQRQLLQLCTKVGTESRHEKTGLLGFQPGSHKPVCTVTEILDLSRRGILLSV